jgi:hypothetical protein
MKLFRDLLLENPDTVYYKRKTYSYTSPANRCAFLVYKDEKSGKNAIFGYSIVKKDFVCDDAEVLKEVEELHKQASIKLDTGNNSDNQLSYWAQRAISNLKNGNSGGGHLDIENLLKGIGRLRARADPLLKGRIFEVFDDKDVVDDSNLKIESTIPSGKAIIVTFWDARREKIIKYKDQYEKVIEFNGYDPKECLYEPSMDFYTYTEFYNNNEPKSIESKPVQPVAGTKASDSFSVGDKVKVKGMNVAGVVLSVSAANTIKLKVNKSDLKTVPVGSEFDFPYYGLQLDTSHTTKFKVGDKIRLKGLPDITGDVTHVDGNHITIEITSSKYSFGAFRQGRALKILASGAELVQPQSDDTVAASAKLDKVIDDKTQEFVEKRGKLHSTGATFTPVEKANLEKEVDSLEIEIKILNDLLTSGEKYYTDNVKDVVATSVQRKLDAKQKEKQDRYSLVKQAEKQYGMPIAQIRQKYRNVPLDQLVKKESLYKKLLKALRG